ncbi:hypothetical protein Tco_0522443 [Tanacetum coccineum]
MDDSKVVLGLEYLNKVRYFPMPFANSLCILYGGKTCMVSMERDAKSGAKTLSVTKVEVLKVINRVLDEFKDVIPKELPKKLPPRREADHTIKLETVPSPSPKPLIICHHPNLFDQLGKARYFSKLDLRSGYYQVWIAEGDEAKTTCVTSHTLEEHVLHLKQVFQVLRDNELYMKSHKCSFAQDEVEFLGHKIKDDGLMMDGEKIKAIQDREPPT